MTNAQWASWATLLWFLDLALLWGSTFIGMALTFIGDPHPSQWGSHLRFWIKGTIQAAIVTVIAFFVVRYGAQHFIALTVLILAIGALNYGVSLLLTIFGKGAVVLTQWGVFGQEAKVLARSIHRVARGTERIPQEPARIIEAQSVTLDRSNDPRREALHKLLDNRMYIYQNMFLEDEQHTGITREEWLARESKLGKFLVWYRSEQGKVARRQAQEHMPSIIDAYLVNYTFEDNPPAVALTIEQIKAHWSRVRTEVATISPRTNALLNSATPYAVADGTLVAVVTYDFHRASLNKMSTGRPSRRRWRGCSATPGGLRVCSRRRRIILASLFLRRPTPITAGPISGIGRGHTASTIENKRIGYSVGHRMA